MFTVWFQTCLTPIFMPPSLTGWCLLLATFSATFLSGFFSLNPGSPTPIIFTPAHCNSRLASYAVVNATFLCGFFSFALLLSIVTEEVQSRLEVVRAGKLPVRAEGHLVVLNW